MTRPATCEEIIQGIIELRPKQMLKIRYIPNGYGIKASRFSVALGEGMRHWGGTTLRMALLHAARRDIKNH